MKINYEGFTQWRRVGCAALLAASLWSPLVVGASDDRYGLPEFTSNSQNLREEARLGHAWLRSFQAQAPQWDDPIAHDYYEGIISRLLPHSGLGDLDTVAVIVDNPALNAFAVPGGIIGVNSGLFAFAKSEGAFASVVAHELAHISQRHYARGVARAEEIQLPAMAGMLVGMAAAAGGAGSAGIAAAMSTQAATLQDRLAYSRQFEKEADYQGIKTLEQAGYDSREMASMFEGMQRMTRLQGGTPPAFLLSHPLSENRLSDAQARADQIQTQEATAVQPDAYDMIRARALHHVHQDAPDQGLMQLRNDDASEDAQAYYSALVSAERGNVAESLAAIDQLAAAHPDLALLPATGAEVALKGDRPTEAIQRSERLLRLMPHYVPAMLVIADAKLHSAPAEAYELLQVVARERPQSVSVHRLLAEAAGRSGRRGWGHFAKGEALQLAGRIEDAQRQLGYARDIADTSGDRRLQARVDSRQEAYEDYQEAMEML